MMRAGSIEGGTMVPPTVKLGAAPAEPPIANEGAPSKPDTADSLLARGGAARLAAKLGGTAMALKSSASGPQGAETGGVAGKLRVTDLWPPAATGCSPISSRKLATTEP